MHEQARRKGGKLPTKRIRKLSKFDTKKFSLPSYEVLKLMARKPIASWLSISVSPP